MKIAFFKSNKDEKAQDPVCLMKVAKDENALFYEYKGETYYFCSESCKDHFDADPKKYIG